MKSIRCAFMVVLIGGLVSCGFVDSQLKRDPVTGESKLEQEVKVAQPFTPAPWGQIAVGAAGLLASIYAAFHAREANKQTDEPKA